MGATPVDRVTTLLAKLHSTAISRNRGSQVSKERELLFSRFAKQVQKIFNNIPKPLEWISFYTNDLKLLVQADQEVRRASIKNKLTKSQTPPTENGLQFQSWQAEELRTGGRMSEVNGEGKYADIDHS